MAEQRVFFSIPEAAAHIGISRIAVFKKVKKGQLTAIRIGRNWAIPAAALQGLTPHPVPLPSEATARKPCPPKKSGVLPRPVLVEKSPPRRDSLDEMGWD
ncbi:MAG: hypothetical protein A2270_04835 [Elusimicrobia bacterium RIFOXYA12_FULL_51_18]|nr:MAG: hypothetical protein A2270_04835 [Elusimicrobia bacterium RIFOXYA12_FULL_51_18]OGS33079.1 MAG: hypothetical protein A2218_04495 [Elusimicrobia bacterium RIFOXYA2_FULL_53_38]